MKTQNIRTAAAPLTTIPANAQGRPPINADGARSRYVLILDAQGHPFAFAPLRRWQHNPFPAERIRLVDGNGNLKRAT